MRECEFVLLRVVLELASIVLVVRHRPSGTARSRAGTRRCSFVVCLSVSSLTRSLSRRVPPPPLRPQHPSDAMAALTAEEKAMMADLMAGLDETVFSDYTPTPVKTKTTTTKHSSSPFKGKGKAKSLSSPLAARSPLSPINRRTKIQPSPLRLRRTPAKENGVRPAPRNNKNPAEGREDGVKKSNVKTDANSMPPANVKTVSFA